MIFLCQHRKQCLLFETEVIIDIEAANIIYRDSGEVTANAPTEAFIGISNCTARDLTPNSYVVKFFHIHKQHFKTVNRTAVKRLILSLGIIGQAQILLFK